MQEENKLYNNLAWNVAFYAIAIFILAADQLSKYWITKFWESSNLVPGQSIFNVGIFSITYIQNTGAAFGIFPGQSFPLMIVGILGATAILVYMLYIRFRFPLINTRTGLFALGLMLGGTLGNLIDRLRFEGRVTDFIDFGFWPVFNIADSSLVIGTIILVLSLLPLIKHTEQHSK